MMTRNYYTGYRISERAILILVLMSLNLFLLNGQSDKKYIRQGNSKYSDGKYPESEISYRKAIDNNKMSQDAIFNLGDALYKQKKYEDAGKIFLENAGSTIDNTKKANSFFNLGNSLLNDKKPEESINAYKNALRLNPGSKETKYNLAYAQDMLKQQQEQQKKDQDKDKDKKGQNKDQNKDKNKDQNKDKKQDQNKDQNKDQKKDQQQQEQDKQSISKEDAQRLLDALANDEKKVQEKVRQEKAAKERVKTIINW